GFYTAKSTGTRTDISQNHKSCGAFAPTFAHIRATAGGADCVEFVFVNQTAQFGIFFSCGKFYAQPFWLWLTLLKFQDFCVHGKQKYEKKPPNPQRGNSIFLEFGIYFFGIYFFCVIISARSFRARSRRTFTLFKVSPSVSEISL